MQFIELEALAEPCRPKSASASGSVSSQPRSIVHVEKISVPAVSNCCPVWLQGALLGFLLVHALGVLSEPLRFFSRSDVRTGPEFVWLGETMKPYSQWLYINHGYFFFAPNPGPSHLIQYSRGAPSALPTDPSPTQKHLLPDRNEHWPRLLYHRYFMLSEFYTSRFAPQQVAVELKTDVDFMSSWASDKVLYDQIQNSIKASLKHSLGTEINSLQRIERALPDSQQVLKDGWTLNDARLTSVLPESMIETTVPLPADVLPGKPTGPQPTK